MCVVAALGAGLSQQAVINASVGQMLNGPVAAAALSMTVSALLLVAVTWWIGTPLRLGAVAALSGWSVLAGLLGAAFVAGSAFLVPVTGAALFFVCLVAGQLTGALVADAVGALGIEPRALSVQKIAGVALAFLGVVLVRFG